MFALAGAGKTTIVKAAAGSAQVTTRKGLSAEWAERSTLQRLGHVGRAFANPKHLATAARFGLKTGISTPESLFRLARLIAKTDWLRSHSGVVLLDQGFLQDLWSILLSGKATRSDPVLLAPLIGTLYQGINATIVLIDVDVQTASRRVRGRTHGDSRFDGLPEEELLKSLQAASKLQHQIIEAARLAGLPVQVLDGSMPPGAAVDRLLALIPAVDVPTDFARKSTGPRRVSIVGSTGSGKSHLARALAERLHLPVCELDELRREGGSSDPSFETSVAGVVQGDEWIIDGHYRHVRQMIWRRADLIVWLNYPLPVVALRLLRRFSGKYGAKFRKKRGAGAHSPEMAGSSGAQSISWRKRFSRLARTLRERREYGRLLRAADLKGAEVVEMTSARMTQQWLKSL